MADRPQPLFLERRSYRHRRLRDVARVLPFLGAVLWLIPLLWPQGDENNMLTSSAAVFIFGAWIVLIVLSALVSRWLGRDAPEDGEPH